MIVAAAALQSQSNHKHCTRMQALQREDSGSPWDADIAALENRNRKFPANIKHSSTEAEEKGSPRFVEREGFNTKRKRGVSFDAITATLSAKNLADNGSGSCIAGSKKGGNSGSASTRKTSTKRARFASPVVSGHLSPDKKHFAAFREKCGAEAKESQQSSTFCTSFSASSKTLQEQLNQNVPRALAHHTDGGILSPPHPAPLSSNTVSDEPLLRKHLQNLFALFWDTLFPILERHGWSYASATAASFECFAVPGITSLARPSALLRSVFEVIQFVKAHGIIYGGGAVSSSPSSNKAPSGDFEREADEKAACHIVDVLLEQRRIIAAVRYNLLRRDMQQQQQRILEHQKLILQSHSSMLNQRSSANTSKQVPVLRPATQRRAADQRNNKSMFGLSLSTGLGSGTSKHGQVKRSKTMKKKTKEANLGHSKLKKKRSMLF